MSRYLTPSFIIINLRFDEMIDFETISAIVCDDIRHEANGKQLLIGVYSGDIVLGMLEGMPGVISSSLWIELRVKTPGDFSLDFKVEVSSRPVFGMDGIKAIVQQAGDIALPLGPFPIAVSGSGEIKYYLRPSGRKWRMIRSKRIILGPISNPFNSPFPTASPPQPSQSPPSARAS